MRLNKEKCVLRVKPKSQKLSSEENKNLIAHLLCSWESVPLILRNERQSFRVLDPGLKNLRSESKKKFL